MSLLFFILYSLFSILYSLFSMVVLEFEPKNVLHIFPWDEMDGFHIPS